MRYGPCNEVATDAPEEMAAVVDCLKDDTDDRKSAIERILKETQGSRVPVEAILDALFPPLVWREGDRVFKQASQ